MPPVEPPAPPPQPPPDQFDQHQIDQRFPTPRMRGRRPDVVEHPLHEAVETVGWTEAGDLAHEQNKNTKPRQMQALFSPPRRTIPLRGLPVRRQNAVRLAVHTQLDRVRQPALKAVQATAGG